MKSISFEGETYTVEDSYKYVARNAGGVVKAYKKRPVRTRIGWRSSGSNLVLPKVPPSGWFASLKEV